MSIQESTASQTPETSDTCVLTDSAQRMARAEHLLHMLAAALLGKTHEALIFGTHVVKHMKPYFAAVEAVGKAIDELKQVLQEMDAAGDDWCVTLPASVAAVLSGHAYSTN